MRFSGKVALITAAANGIGRATATIMVREGATVIAVDNNQSRLDEAVPALRQAETLLREILRQRGPRPEQRGSGASNQHTEELAIVANLARGAKVYFF